MASSAKVREALSQVPGAPDQAAAFDALLSNLKTLSTPETLAADLKATIDAVFSSSQLGIVGQRSVVASFTAALRATDDPELWVDVGQHALEILAGGGATASSGGAAGGAGGGADGSGDGGSGAGTGTGTGAAAVAVVGQGQTTFVDQAVALRELTADGHEATEDYLGAARALAEIPLDASQRRVTDADRARVWVRIVRCYLEVDDTTAAETYLNKLKGVIHDVADADPALHLHFRLSQARIRDAKREFLAASQAYHDISFSAAIAEEERLHTLSMAVKCALLAPAGPLRSRMLGRLFKDERAVALEEFGMLEKMFFDRLLSPDEVGKFAQGLQPHQLATTSDGSTVLAKAVVEHNLLGASRLYSNIGFAALGALLGLDPARAEDTTARMIEQGRLVGRIDQIEQVIYFEGGEASGEKGSGRAEGSVGKEMRRWDANVQGLAEEVENVTNALQREFPVGIPPSKAKQTFLVFSVEPSSEANKNNHLQDFVAANLVV
ncbi:hypothetical protein SLS62_004347 [Diatrype stigma]|uniref:COP9 signalosome complex subunit 4 n=1 Tax=Diatrype stigma TaxID=117547 RepID=A0AAN9YPC6_9PEZI